MLPDLHDIAAGVIALAPVGAIAVLLFHLRRLLRHARKAGGH